MRLVDIANSPNFNPSTNSGRGDWSLHDVSNGNVSLDDWWQKPECIDHGAINCVSKDLTIWRCIECGRGAFDMDRVESQLRQFDIWSEGYVDNGGRSDATYFGVYMAKSFDDAVQIYIDSNPNYSKFFSKSEGHWSFWGCRLFDNETEARKSFG